MPFASRRCHLCALTLFVMTLFVVAITPSVDVRRDIIFFNTSAAERLLELHLTAMSSPVPFSRFAGYVQTQHTETFCGLATVASLLNALTTDEPATRRPRDAALLTHAFFTQDGFFAHPHEARCVQSAIGTRERVMRGGLVLRNVGDLIQCYTPLTGVRARVYGVGEAIGQGHFVSWTVDALRRGDGVAVNMRHDYARPVACRGCSQQGHWSPVVAHASTSDGDFFLVADVATYALPWAWVRASALYGAMHTVDPVTYRYRGFVLVERGGPHHVHVNTSLSRAHS